MSYFHVVAKRASEERYRSPFFDLSEADLMKLFVHPYEQGKAFFSGNDLISPSELSSIIIVKTANESDVERAEINRKSLERIDEINRSNDGPVFISAGSGYDPEDIAEAGEDVTHAYIKGEPGYKADRFAPPLKVAAWVGGILATVIGAGIIKWLGWV